MAERLLCSSRVLAKAPFAFPCSGTGGKCSFLALQANVGAWGGYKASHKELGVIFPSPAGL